LNEAKIVLNWGKRFVIAQEQPYYLKGNHARKGRTRSKKNSHPHLLEISHHHYEALNADNRGVTARGSSLICGLSGWPESFLHTTPTSVVDVSPGIDDAPDR
jgi:hypothetical protein